MTTEERPWPRRAPPDASAGYNIFTGHRVSSESNEGTSGGVPQASNMQGVVHGDGNGDRMWPNRYSSVDFNIYNNAHNSMTTDGYTSFGAPTNQDRPSIPNRQTSTDFNMYNNIRNSLGASDGYTSFGAPMNQDGSNVTIAGGSGIRQSFRKPPLDPLLIPRNQPSPSPASSQANSFIFEGSVPLSARRHSPLRTSSNSSSTNSFTPTSSFTPTAAGSPSLFTRRRPSAPVQSRTGGLQPRVPNSPSTSPWHGRSSSDSFTFTTQTPSPSNSSFGYYAMGPPPFQAPTWPVGPSTGASLDNYGPANYGYNSFGTSEMMNDLFSMRRSKSVPNSPTMHWSFQPNFGSLAHSSSPFGEFGSFGTNYERGSYVEDIGHSEMTPTGISGIGLLEDAIREQHFEKVVALLEHGFSPNGEQGSPKTPPLLIAVSTGNERLVKLLLETGANVNGCDSRQYTPLHYAAASGYRGIVNLLLLGGANIYAKTDDDLLPIQLATDSTIYEYISAKMKMDMEGRMSPKNVKFLSQGSLNFSSFQSPNIVDYDQWIDQGAENVTTNPRSGYQKHELTSSIQDFGESPNMQSRVGGIERQGSLSFVGPDVGSRLMDWEVLRNFQSEPIHQVLVHPVFTNQSPNIISNDLNDFRHNQGLDTVMQEKIGVSRGSPLTRLPLQRTSNMFVGHLNNLDIPFQSNEPFEPNNGSTNVIMMPTIPTTTSDFEQKAFNIETNKFQIENPLLQFAPTITVTGAVENFEKTKAESLDASHSQDMKVSKTIHNYGNEDTNEINSLEHSPRMQKKISRACDSMAPSMMEKFRASTSSGRSLELLEIEEMFTEKKSEIPQAPETPRQVGEPQDNSQGTASTSQKEKAYCSIVSPTSALKGEAKKLKEGKKTVTFALVESPSEEDLASIREDWHEAARSGCVGCGKPNCQGQCLTPQTLPFASTSDVASSSSNSSGKKPLEELSIALDPIRPRAVKWTRGELLGEGAYGKVFAGLNQDTGELMAVKQLKLDIAAEGEERQFYLAALEREISFYKTMRHKHIVGYIDMEQDLETGSLYVFLEYVSGGSIQSMLERFGRFSEPLVKVYTRQLLLGLEYLHGKKIVHRDIKGGNVLVDADGIVKLADFGASKAFHDPTQTDGFKSIRGSVFWMAPEVIKGDGYGRRADIWSVGCTVVEMLTAVHPWPGMDNTWTAIFHIAKASSGPPIPEGISPIVEDFLSLCFQLDPKKRPTSSELLQHPFVAEGPTLTT